MKTILLGASGYIGSAFVDALILRGVSFATVKGRGCTEGEFRKVASEIKPTHVINCAAYIPTPSVDLCKDNKPETWRANVHLPVMLARVCQELGITFCHISTACLYDDAREYTEDDFPTRLGNGYCGFYLNTKWFAEELVNNLCESHYIWRIRLPFDETDHPKNFISKLRNHNTLWHHQNSLTHRRDFARSALDMIEKKAAWGTYHMTNSGNISTLTVNGMMIEKGLSENGKRFVSGPVTGSILSTAKLEATGCGMRPVREAVSEALGQWRKE